MPALATFWYVNSVDYAAVKARAASAIRSFTPGP
ncbi:hypothetical protein ACVILL_000260 [Bradyrhizobium sp. USDA 3364]